MISSYLFPAAGMLTLIAAYLIWEGVWKQSRFSERPLLILLMLAILLTSIGLYELDPVTARGIQLRLSSSVAISILLILFIYAMGLSQHGIRGLGLIILPVTTIPLLLLPWLPDIRLVWIKTTSALEAGHLLISLLSYAVLTLAAAHALMYLQIDRSLKRKRINKLFQHLPPLQDIGNYMSAQIRMAVWLLGIGIALGLIWQWEEMSSITLLTHKVLLSLFSWGLLLWLHLMSKRSGWHGKRVSIMVLTAYMLLLLSYFGVRLIQYWVEN